MGLFDRLFGVVSRSTVQTEDDHLWFTNETRCQGLIQQVNGSDDSAVILLIAHFPDRLEELKVIAENYAGDVPIQATLAENLEGEIAAALRIYEDATVDLIVAEKHPLLSADIAVMEFAKQIPCYCRLTYHLSLEDRLLKTFSSASVKRVLDSLGVKDNEAIRSNMVTRRVKAAQQRIEASATGNSTASSATEWLELNSPST